MHIRDPTVDQYSIINFRWPKSVDNVSLVHIGASYINMVLAIVTTVLMVYSAAPFLCEAPAPLNPIFFCLFSSFSIKYEVLNIPLSVVLYTFINTP